MVVMGPSGFPGAGGRDGSEQELNPGAGTFFFLLNPKERRNILRRRETERERETEKELEGDGGGGEGERQRGREREGGGGERERNIYTKRLSKQTTSGCTCGKRQVVERVGVRVSVGSRV